MDKLLLSQIKSDTPLVTFKCEGCGLRFLEKDLYVRNDKELRDLNNGDGFQIVFIKGHRKKILTKLVCSKECFDKAKIHSVQDWFSVFINDKAYLSYIHEIKNQLDSMTKRKFYRWKEE